MANAIPVVIRSAAVRRSFFMVFLGVGFWSPGGTPGLPYWYSPQFQGSLAESEKTFSF
jgi:hypothetical protein